RTYPPEKFDVIFANLPYIPTDRIHKLPVSVRGYEPLSALDGGVDGLEFIRKLLNSAKKYLNKGGVIILEVDDTHTIRHTKEFEKEWNIEVKNDYNGKNRFWIARSINK